MAIRKAGAGNAAPTAAPGEDEGTEGAEVLEGSIAGTKTKAGAKVEPVANEALVALFEKYDEQVEKAESYFIELVEHIQTNQLPRATVVLSMMKARQITFETAQSQYSRMKKIFNNEEVLKDLKDGNITLKVAREKTATPQKNPTSSKPEAKEARFSNTLKAFVAAAKESGLALKEIMLSVEAELKSAQIK